MEFHVTEQVEGSSDYNLKILSSLVNLGHTEISESVASNRLLARLETTKTCL